MCVRFVLHCCIHTRDPVATIWSWAENLPVCQVGVIAFGVSLARASTECGRDFK